MVANCPVCVNTMAYRSRVCRACDLSARRGVHRIGNCRTGSCPRCGGSMNPRSAVCWDCSIATRSERHGHNTGPKRRPVVDRLISRAVWDGDCLVWQGSRNGSGYGQIGVGRRLALVHRLAYELFVGQIPPGLTVDHLCGTRLCINAFHLDVCSLSENSRRAAAKRRNT